MNEKSRKTRFRWEGAQYSRALGGVNRCSSFSDRHRAVTLGLVCGRLSMNRCNMLVLCRQWLQWRRSKRLGQVFRGFSRNGSIQG